MLLCNECSIKEICLIYNDLKNYLHIATVNVEKCSHRVYIGEKYKNNKDNIAANTRTTEIKEKDENIKNRISKITELSNKHREQKKHENEKEIQEAKPKMLAKPLELDYTCPTCNGKTFKGDIGTCTKCNTTICSCCATIDGDTKAILCSDCWANS